MNTVIPVSIDSDAAPRQSAPTTPLSLAQKLFLSLGVVLFDWLFWREGSGVNMLVFMLFIIIVQLVLLPRHAAVRRSGYFWLMVGGSLFGAVMMAVYGSAVAALACLASVLMLLGYVNQPHLKLVLYALLTAANSVAQAWVRVLQSVRAPRNTGAGVRRSWFYRARHGQRIEQPDQMQQLRRDLGGRFQAADAAFVAVVVGVVAVGGGVGQQVQHHEHAHGPPATPGPAQST
jgi:hypothetical protein